MYLDKLLNEQTFPEPAATESKSSVTSGLCEGWGHVAVLEFIRGKGLVRKLFPRTFCINVQLSWTNRYMQTRREGHVGV